MTITNEQLTLLDPDFGLDEPLVASPELELPNQSVEAGVAMAGNPDVWALNDPNVRLYALISSDEGDEEVADKACQAFNGFWSEHTSQTMTETEAQGLMQQSLDHVKKVINPEATAKPKNFRITAVRGFEDETGAQRAAFVRNGAHPIIQQEAYDEPLYFLTDPHLTEQVGVTDELEAGHRILLTTKSVLESLKRYKELSPHPEHGDTMIQEAFNTDEAQAAAETLLSTSLEYQKDQKGLGIMFIDMQGKATEEKEDITPPAAPNAVEESTSQEGSIAGAALAMGALAKVIKGRKIAALKPHGVPAFFKKLVHQAKSAPITIPEKIGSLAFNRKGAAALIGSVALGGLVYMHLKYGGIHPNIRGPYSDVAKNLAHNHGTKLPNTSFAKDLSGKKANAVSSHVHKAAADHSLKQHSLASKQTTPSASAPKVTGHSSSSLAGARHGQTAPTPALHPAVSHAVSGLRTAGSHLPVRHLPAAPPEAILHHAQNMTVELHAGDNPWDEAERYLIKSGIKKPTTAQINAKTTEILVRNGITNYSAHFLKVGQKLVIPGN